MIAMITFEGVIKFIGPEQTVGQKGLQKISFILEENVDKEFKSSIAVDVLGEKVGLIKDFKVGDVVKAFLNFKANEYEGKRFNRVSAWKIEGMGGAAVASSSKEKTDDLPF